MISTLGAQAPMLVEVQPKPTPFADFNPSRTSSVGFAGISLVKVEDKKERFAREYHGGNQRSLNAQTLTKNIV